MSETALPRTLSDLQTVNQIEEPAGQGYGRFSALWATLEALLDLGDFEIGSFTWPWSWSWPPHRQDFAARLDG